MLHAAFQPSMQEFKRILVAEDDLNDIKPTLGARSENHLANAADVVRDGLTPWTICYGAEVLPSGPSCQLGLNGYFVNPLTSRRSPARSDRLVCIGPALMNHRRSYSPNPRRGERPRY